MERCTYVALAANHLVAVELGGQSLQGRLNDTTTQTEDQVEGGLLYIRISIPFLSFLLSSQISTPLAMFSHRRCRNAVPQRRTFWML